MPDITHIHTSGGLISAAFIENMRELGSRQRGIEPEKANCHFVQEKGR